MKYEREIYEVMKDLGVCPQNLGYTYSIYIVNEILVGNFNASTPIVKGIYPEVAEKFNTTGSRVERAIRHSVESICKNTDTEVLYKYFGNCLNPKSGKVSNHAFLVCIAEYIRVYMLNG